MSSVIDLLLGIEQAVASVISVTVRLEEMMYATEEISREKLDDFFDDLEWVLDELFEDLMAGFAARDGVSNLEERLASASDLGAWATEAINTFGNSYGIPDATRNRYVGELYPYITYLVLKFGEISEQHPRLLKALLVDIVRRDRELDEFRTTHSSEQASQPTSVAVSDNTGLGLPVGQYAMQLYHSVRKFIEDLLSGAFEAFHATAKSLASDIITFAKDVHRATTAFWDGDQGLAESATDIAESLGGIVKHNLNVETLLAIVVPILNPVFVVLPGPLGLEGEQQGGLSVTWAGE
ncbi:hypothetical protein WOLCODRAFT_146235 [Wolfiporia cocos MD-104 SS10]|uniref:Uncharacterized protein n=1 Tax=Wolfiporia cocos (strain MD-104) TaxID=742152 RepID=A0A2H3JK42_WOLCO|nr:hypothetical protein WOLCODRAFT_146235 [Wolfiporia cocos MD-104 SS10]